MLNPWTNSERSSETLVRGAPDRASEHPTIILRTVGADLRAPPGTLLQLLLELLHGRYAQCLWYMAWRRLTPKRTPAFQTGVRQPSVWISSSKDSPPSSARSRHERGLLDSKPSAAAMAAGREAAGPAGAT